MFFNLLFKNEITRIRSNLVPRVLSQRDAKYNVTCGYWRLAKKKFLWANLLSRSLETLNKLTSIFANLKWNFMDLDNKQRLNDQEEEVCT